MFNINFISLFLGRIFTNFADSLYKILTAWLLYKMTGNVAISGLGTAIISLPEIFVFLVGPIIDRHNKRNLLLICTLGQIVGLFLILCLHFFDVLTPTLLIVAMFIITCFNTPTYFIEQSMLPSVVNNKKHMVTANSLFSFTDEGIDVVFNAISGFVVALASLTVILLTNIVVYGVALGLFFLIKLAPKMVNNQDTSAKEIEEDTEEDERFDEGVDLKTFVEDLKESWRIMMLPELLPTILPVIAFNLVFAGIFVSFPYLASQVGDSRYYGLLLSAVSVGTFIGAILATPLSRYFTISQLVIYPGILMIVSLIALYFSLDSFYISLILFTIMFIETGIGNIILPTYNQMILPEHYLGRVSSSIGSLITLGYPIGAALGGAIVEYASFKLLLIITMVVQAFSLLYWIRSKPFRRLGRLHEIKVLDLK